MVALVADYCPDEVLHWHPKVPARRAGGVCPWPTGRLPHVDASHATCECKVFFPKALKESSHSQSWGPWGEQLLLLCVREASGSITTCDCLHFWTFACRQCQWSQDGAPAGRDPCNCRHFWALVFLSPVRARDQGEGRDATGRVATFRPLSSLFSPRARERGRERGRQRERERERGEKGERLRQRVFCFVAAYCLLCRRLRLCHGIYIGRYQCGATTWVSYGHRTSTGGRHPGLRWHQRRQQAGQ